MTEARLGQTSAYPPSVLPKQKEHTKMKGQCVYCAIHEEVVLQRLLFLDSLRFVAAMMVVVFHYSHRGGLKYTNFRMESIDPITRYGYLGVELFFIISGFVIFYSIKNSNNFMDFLVKRFFRLWPSLAFAAIITFLITQLFDFSHTKSILALGCNIALPLVLCDISGIGYIDGVYWSLAIEVIFYVIMAFFIATKVNKSELYTKISLVLWILICSLLLFTDSLDGIVKSLLSNAFISNYAFYFIIGICCYKIWDGHSKSKSYHIILFVATALSAIHAYSTALELSADRNVEYLPWIPSLITFGFSIIMLAYSHKLFELKNPIYVQLGAITYPLYLLHQNIGYIIINKTTPIINNEWIILIIPIAASILLSMVLLRTSEVWSKKLSKWYSRRKQTNLINKQA